MIKLYLFLGVSSPVVSEEIKKKHKTAIGNTFLTFYISPCITTIKGVNHWHILKHDVFDSTDSLSNCLLVISFRCTQYPVEYNAGFSYLALSY